MYLLSINASEYLTEELAKGLIQVFSLLLMIRPRKKK